MKILLQSKRVMKSDGWNWSGNRQITPSQPIRIGRDERPKPIARNVTGHHIGRRSRNRIVVTGWTIREIRDPDFLTHETHEPNEIKGASGRRSACPANFASFRVFSGPA